jgi:serine phosphatase RsbU (regulator of sigma subunit)
METDNISLMCAPLKAENKVVGVLLLMSEAPRTFTAGDLKLLNAIAMQTAPAIEIAHLHQVELENAWLERDLDMARRVQSGLLPSQMPVLPGWDVAAFWRPARMVSGDLYDFIYFPDGKLGLVVADVTDKGVPAALLMANARSVLRGAAASAGRSGWDSPSRLMAQVNEVLSEEMPMDMFVTCLLAVLDPNNGHVRFANAGHNPPYLRTAQGVVELRATGIPLGLFPDLEYEEKEAHLENGDTLLMYSDGLTEAHDPQREMFGFPRLRQLLVDLPGDLQVQSSALIDQLIGELETFTGPGWEQEDDITMITVTRAC